MERCCMPEPEVCKPQHTESVMPKKSVKCSPKPTSMKGTRPSMETADPSFKKRTHVDPYYTRKISFELQQMSSENIMLRENYCMKIIKILLFVI